MLATSPAEEGRVGVAYQVANDNLAVTGSSRGLGRGLLSSSLRLLGVLLNTANGGDSGGTARGTACRVAATTAATSLALGRDDLVKRLVELAGHLGCRRLMCREKFDQCVAVDFRVGWGGTSWQVSGGLRRLMMATKKLCRVAECNFSSCAPGLVAADVNIRSFCWRKKYEESCRHS